MIRVVPNVGTGLACITLKLFVQVACFLLLGESYATCQKSLKLTPGTLSIATICKGRNQMPLNLCGIGRFGQSLLQKLYTPFGLPLLNQQPA